MAAVVPPFGHAALPPFPPSPEARPELSSRTGSSRLQRPFAAVFRKFVVVISAISTHPQKLIVGFVLAVVFLTGVQGLMLLRTGSPMLAREVFAGCSNSPRAVSPHEMPAREQCCFRPLLLRPRPSSQEQTPRQVGASCVVGRFRVLITTTSNKTVVQSRPESSAHTLSVSSSSLLKQLAFWIFSTNCCLGESGSRPAG